MEHLDAMHKLEAVVPDEHAGVSSKARGVVQVERGPSQREDLSKQVSSKSVSSPGIERGGY